MLVTSDTPKMLVVAYKPIFQETFDNVPVVYNEFTQTVPAPQGQIAVNWIGAPPVVSEFTDERKVKGLKEYGYTISTKKWENTIAIDRALWERDQQGIIKMKVQAMAEAARRYMDQRCIEKLAAGSAATCYDGQNFFSDSHSEGDSGTQDNLATGALDSTTLQAAITAMYKFKDDTGRPLGIIADTLVIPPDLEWTAMGLLNSTMYPDEITGKQNLSLNTLKGRLRLIVTPYLTDTNNWFVLATKYANKPMVCALEQSVAFEQNVDGDDAFNRDEWRFGTRALYEFGYGDWRYAYGGIVSGA